LYSSNRTLEYYEYQRHRDARFSKTCSVHRHRSVLARSPPVRGYPAQICYLPDGCGRIVVPLQWSCYGTVAGVPFTRQGSQVRTLYHPPVISQVNQALRTSLRCFFSPKSSMNTLYYYCDVSALVLLGFCNHIDLGSRQWCTEHYASGQGQSRRPRTIYQDRAVSFYVSSSYESRPCHLETVDVMISETIRQALVSAPFFECASVT
jgi:hypothetical protein